MAAFGSFVQIVGILFDLGDPGTRLDQEDKKLMHWIQCFCGPEFMHNVTVVTSSWDKHSEDGFEQAYNRMQTLDRDEIFKQLMEPKSEAKDKRYQGPSMYHHGCINGELSMESYPCLSYKRQVKERSEELQNLIRRRYSKQNFKPIKLQFQAEIDKNPKFFETQAAKVLRAPHVNVTTKIVDGKYIVSAVKVKDEDDEPPLQFNKAPETNEKTLGEIIWGWYKLAQEIADYYRERGRAGADARDGARRAWDRIRNWWAGSSKQDTEI